MSDNRFKIASTPDKEIEQMNFKELRSEVRLLRDEMARMVRFYEDALYNLDENNFGKSFTVQQNKMKAQIKINAKGIESKVSKTELEALEESTIAQTAQQISATVTKDFVTNLIGDDVVTNTTFKSQFDMYADGIYSYVSETRDDLESSIASVSITADSFETRVSDLEDFKTSTFIQSADGFLLDGEKAGFTGYIYLTDAVGNRRFTLFYDNSQGPEQVVMHSVYADGLPLVLGRNQEDVFLGHQSNGYEVATRQWVLENAGGSGSAVAKFG